MKKIVLFFSLISGLIISLNAQTANFTKSILFTIGQGEKPVYSECSLFLKSTGTSVSMVTITESGKYFLYENGKKSGPFDKTDEIDWIPDEDFESMNSSIYIDERRVNPDEMISSTDEGKMHIKSGGKSYGPFQIVLNLFADDAGKMTAAITAEGMSPSLLTQSGKIIPLEGMPSYTSVSPSGKIVLIAVVKEFNPAQDLLNVDFSKLSDEQILKLMKEIEEKQKAAPKPEAYIYFNDGKKLGPYPKDAISGNNPTFCKTGGDNWIMTSESKLYVNGTILADLGSEYVSNDDIWLSPDGKRYVIITYDKITFSDGSTFNYPLKTKTLQKDGKTWLTWVSLENNNEIVLYSKPL